MHSPLNRLNQIESRLPEALHADIYAIKREIRYIRKNLTHASQKINSKILQLEKRVQSSIKKKAFREENVPCFQYPENLPITAKKDEIIQALTEHRVLIIAGETGSGKTTQIPKFCLNAGRGIAGKIACTQPRRIAAITVAQRIAQELNEEIGQSVGYKIRFQDKTRPQGYIKLMTDGILLAEARVDPYLNAYDTIIVDEAHERSLNIDFILGMLNERLARRKNLHLIITSATIDTEKFSRAFGGAKIIEVSGRTYPVEVRYFPPSSPPGKSTEVTHVEWAAQAYDKLHAETALTGDVLIFMPTEQDIRDTQEILEGRKYIGVTILPLFGRLASSDQQRVFKPIPGRKVIIATNVAETSITIPGIKFVIDTGLARISTYSPRTRTTGLPVVPISQSSANQRQGRCGRVENGICIRLYEEKDYEARPQFTPPEIVRTNLADVILRMIALRLGDIASFPFIDPPPPRSIKDGIDMLLELNAIYPTPVKQRKRKGDRYRLTDTGKIMANLPIDPRLARMLIQAKKEGCIGALLVITSALSIQDPRERPLEKAAQADEKHALFKDPLSDFLAFINIWNVFHRFVREKKGINQQKKFCVTHFLSYRRMREWRDIYYQLLEVLKEHDQLMNTAEVEHHAPVVKLPEPVKASQAGFSEAYIAIHKSILSGFLSNIAMQKENNLFTAAKDKLVMIFPGSGLFNTAKKWIVAGEIVETSQVYARVVANIDPFWLEPLGKPMCKYTYLDPHWEKKREEVIASEQVTLFGLVIVAGRKVSYGPINPEEATDIFIRQALVKRDVKTSLPFMQHNAALIEDIEELEHKIRKKDVLISEEDLVEFYKRRLDGFYDLRSLAKFIKQKGNDAFLRFNREELLNYMPSQEALAEFPDQIQLGNHVFPCSYQFDPGQKEDGATVIIPRTLAGSFPASAADWLVPGLYKEKVTHLIKTLPKEFRKQLVPVARTVETIIHEMPKTDRPLITALGDFIYRKFKIDIPSNAWDEKSLPAHLTMRFALTAQNGKVIATSRDKSILARHNPPSSDLPISNERKKQWEKDNLTGWTLGDLPVFIPIEADQPDKGVLYPGLVHENGQIHLRLHPDQPQATRSHVKGVAALMAQKFSKDLKSLKKDFILPPSLREKAQPFGGHKQVASMMYHFIIRELFEKNIRTQTSYENYLKEIAPQIFATGQRLLEKCAAILTAFEATTLTLKKIAFEFRQRPSKSTQYLNTLNTHLRQLAPENFIDLYDLTIMTHLPRYLKAIELRAQRGVSNPEKDARKAQPVIEYTEKLSRTIASLTDKTSPEKRAAVESFYWMLEEFKVSVFAQELKTPYKISLKRLDKEWADIERMI